MNLEKPEVTGVQTVSRHDERITTGLGTAPVYRKSAEIIVTIASGGEEIITTLADGTVETKNTASAGDAIVTNPGGEQYIIKKETFEKRYEPKESVNGAYTAKGYCKAIDNPFGQPITMLASWGEMQNGNVDCIIADTYDPKTQEIGGEPYIIGRSEFESTYRPE